MSSTIDLGEYGVEDVFTVIDGINWFRHWNIDTLRFALKYEPHSNDIFIVTYPKSGTTWMKTIIYTLLTNGQPFDNDRQDFFERIPFLEFETPKAVLNMRRPGAIKTHLPMNRVPYNSQAKYICIIRNPKDVCVSFYFFYNTWAYAPRLTFNQFFELFIKGCLPFNDYFECLRLTWERRHDKNVLLLSYEEMKSDIKAIIQKVAAFINIDLTDQLLEKVVQYSSYNYMKDKYDDERQAFEIDCIKNTEDKEVAVQMQKHFDAEVDLKLVRKGQINDWKSYMTPEQNKRIYDRFIEICQECDELREFWTKWNVF